MEDWFVSATIDLLLGLVTDLVEIDQDLTPKGRNHVISGNRKMIPGKIQYFEVKILNNQIKLLSATSPVFHTSAASKSAKGGSYSYCPGKRKVSMLELN